MKIFFKLLAKFHHVPFFIKEYWQQGHLSYPSSFKVLDNCDVIEFDEATARVNSSVCIMKNLKYRYFYKICSCKGAYDNNYEIYKRMGMENLIAK